MKYYNVPHHTSAASLRVGNHSTAPPSSYMCMNMTASRSVMLLREAPTLPMDGRTRLPCPRQHGGTAWYFADKAASEMYAKLHGHVTDVFSAVEKHSASKTVKNHIEYLFSHSLQNAVLAKGTSTTGGSAGVDSAAHDSLSSPWLTVDVAMNLLKKLNNIPAYLIPNMRNSANRNVNILRAVFANIHSKTLTKNTRIAETQAQEECKNDEPAHAVVNVESSPAGAEVVHTEPSEMSAEEESEGTADSSSTAAEECSSHTVSEDRSATQERTEVQQSTQEENEANTTVPRPRSRTFSSLFRHSVAAQLPKKKAIEYNNLFLKYNQ